MVSSFCLIHLLLPSSSKASCECSTRTIKAIFKWDSTQHSMSRSVEWLPTTVHLLMIFLDNQRTQGLRSYRARYICWKEICLRRRDRNWYRPNFRMEDQRHHSAHCDCGVLRGRDARRPASTTGLPRSDPIRDALPTLFWPTTAARDHDCTQLCGSRVA